MYKGQGNNLKYDLLTFFKHINSLYTQKRHLQFTCMQIIRKQKKTSR